MGQVVTVHTLRVFTRGTLFENVSEGFTYFLEDFVSEDFQGKEIYDPCKWYHYKE